MSWNGFFCLLQISAFSVVANAIRAYAAVVHMVLFHIMVEATVPLMHQHREDWLDSWRNWHFCQSNCHTRISVCNCVLITKKWSLTEKYNCYLRFFISDILWQNSKCSWYPWVPWCQGEEALMWKLMIFVHAVCVELLWSVVHSVSTVVCSWSHFVCIIYTICIVWWWSLHLCGLKLQWFTVDLCLW